MSEAPGRIWAWDDRTPTERDKGWSACDAGTGSTEYIRADLTPFQSVTIPESHPDLNLFAWIDLRRKQVGPWADYIITEVGKLEQEIARMRSGAPAGSPCRQRREMGLNFWLIGNSGHLKS